MRYCSSKKIASCTDGRPHCKLQLIEVFATVFDVATVFAATVEKCLVMLSDAQLLQFENMQLNWGVLKFGTLQCALEIADYEKI
ncbi:unnamed protein product [Gongylonema pulchrum]|uniref:NR LBD domain-containing protein n=1 Tax=Gongylonema pulchrum TaxID=637853 RepID=A0A183ET84_9BILA|nr:unnamed protein product [Gongylonema pulchrum]